MAEVGEKKFKGRIDVSDVIQDAADDIHCSAPFTPKTPEHVAVKTLLDSADVKTSLVDAITAFQRDFTGLTEEGIAVRRHSSGTNGGRSSRRVNENKQVTAGTGRRAGDGTRIRANGGCG